MKTRNRISEKDDLKIKVFDKKGKLVNVVYDSGFRNLSHAISCAVSGLQCKVKAISIDNERNGKYGYYNANGKRL